MPTLNINGKRVKVSDSFMQLSPEEQQATVEEIAASFSQPEPQGGSIADAAGQGLTFGFADEIAGGLGATVNSAANLFGKGTGESFGKAYTGIRDAARENRDAFATRNPGTALAAEIGGGLLTGGVGAAKVGAFKGAQSLAKLGSIGAVEGGAYGLGASDADTVGGLAKDTAIGATVGGVGGTLLPAAGQAVGKKLRRAASRLSASLQSSDDSINSLVTAKISMGEKLSPEQLSTISKATRATGNRYIDDVKLLEDAGLTLTTGQKTGSKAVKSFETTIDKTFAGGAVDKAFQKQREQLQARLLKMAGAADDIAATGKVTDDVLEATADNVSKQYTAALKGKTVSLGDDFIDDLAMVEVKHNRLLTPQQRNEVRTLIDDFLDEAIEEPLSGERYQALRSFVSKRSRQTKMNNPQISKLFYDMTKALDDSFVRSTGASTKALNETYAQYSQLRELWRRHGGASMASGDVPLASLNTMAKKMPGSDEWRRLINAASSVLGDTVPNSGTASRAANMMSIGTGVVPSFVLNQALSRGVGGNAPQMLAKALSGAGSGMQNAATMSGVSGVPVGLQSINRQKATADMLSR